MRNILQYMGAAAAWAMLSPRGATGGAGTAPTRQPRTHTQTPTRAPAPVPDLGERTTVQYLEPPTRGPKKAAPRVSIPDQQIDEGGVKTLQANVVDPDAPGQTNHMWFAWQQLSGPGWMNARGQWQPSMTVTAPQVNADEHIAAQLTVTKRGNLMPRGVQTTAKFLLRVRDVASQPPVDAPLAPPGLGDPMGGGPGLLELLDLLQGWPGGWPATENVPPDGQGPSEGVPPGGPGQVPTPPTRQPPTANPTPPTRQPPLPNEPPTRQPPTQGPPTREPPGPQPPNREPPGRPERPNRPPPPIVAAGETARVYGDPHFQGGDGGKFDVQGRPGETYNLLSDAGLTFHGTFRGDKRVTFVRSTDLTVTGRAGTSRVHVNAKKNLYLVDGKELPRGKSAVMADGGKTTRTGKRELRTRTREGYEIVQHDKGGHIDAEVHTGKRGVHHGQMPTGLMGHTFDADDKARDGKKGHGAQGEGAIDGVYTDYAVAGFDPHFYLAMYADVAASLAGKGTGKGKRARNHFDSFGRAEGRVGHPTGAAGEFDENYYLRGNPDVAKAVAKGDFRSGAHHFWRHGRGEGRKPHA